MSKRYTKHQPMPHYTCTCCAKKVAAVSLDYRGSHSTMDMDNELADVDAERGNALSPMAESFQKIADASARCPSRSSRCWGRPGFRVRIPAGVPAPGPVASPPCASGSGLFMEGDRVTSLPRRNPAGMAGECGHRRKGSFKRPPPS